MGKNPHTELVHTSLNRDSDSSIPANSSGIPNCVINSVALSRANFLASPLMGPWSRLSNSGRLLLTCSKTSS